MGRENDPQSDLVCSRAYAYIDRVFHTSGIFLMKDVIRLIMVRMSSAGCLQ
jgi:hypothetical protein